MVAGFSDDPGSPAAARQVAPQIAAVSTTSPLNHPLPDNPYTCPRFVLLKLLEWSLTPIFAAFYLEGCNERARSGTARSELEEIAGRVLLAGWVARTRPLAGPLSPRGPQPVIMHVSKGHYASQWAASANSSGTHVLVLATLISDESYHFHAIHNKGLILCFLLHESSLFSASTNHDPLRILFWRSTAVWRHYHIGKPNGDLPGLPFLQQNVFLPVGVHSIRGRP